MDGNNKKESQSKEQDHTNSVTLWQPYQEIDFSNIF